MVPINHFDVLFNQKGATLHLLFGVDEGLHALFLIATNLMDQVENSNTIAMMGNQTTLANLESTVFSCSIFSISTFWA